MKKAQLLDHAKELYDEKQLASLGKAIDFATKKHAGQKRKSGEPYIVHPMTTASYLIDWGLDVSSVIAGVLHDTVEDTDTTLEEIGDKFGDDIAFLVDGVTELSKLREGMREINSYLPATKDNLTKLLIATGKDVRVVIIRLADRLHNLQTLSALSKDKQKKIALESLHVFARLADRLNMGWVRVQIEEISFSYIEPQRYNYLKKQLKKRLGRASKKLDHVREDVSKLLTQNNIDFEMDGRIKSVYSLHKKLNKCEQDFEDIYDLIALRFIVPDKAACYQVLGLIHSLYTPMTKRIKDYIAMPKSNGYQSLHTTVVTPDEQIVEFQIRTRKMHDYSERGLAASFYYNEQKLTDDYKKGEVTDLPTDLNWIRELQQAAARLTAGQEIDTEKLRVNLFSDQIFVFSPRGDIFDLPEGSKPLDFAYRVHSDIGSSAQSFKVNGKIASFDTILKTGDIVEVVTRRNIKPSLTWLTQTKTPHAQQKIRQELKKETPKN